MPLTPPPASTRSSGLAAAVTPHLPRAGHRHGVVIFPRASHLPLSPRSAPALRTSHFPMLGKNAVGDGTATLGRLLARLIGDPVDSEVVAVTGDVHLGEMAGGRLDRDHGPGRELVAGVVAA